MLVTSLCLVGCYTGAPANRDVATSWVGHTRVELEHRWGVPVARDANLSTWTFERTHLELPGGGIAVTATPVTLDAAAPNGATLHARGTLIGLAATFHPGAIVKVTTAAVAAIDPAGAVAEIDGAALHWGPPNDANLHWGTIFGAHVGFGRLDTTGTPLPSGGAYIGGMLTPTFGLAGVYELVAGTSDRGSAMGMAGGVVAQWWPVNRFALRVGPALLLAFDPGFENARLRPGAVVGASYAVIKVGVLAIDLRLDLAAGPSTAFGTAGVGIAVN
ncbi:MAG: hypothetical protein ABI591_23815 [Kofleriaceae bacterium]